MTAAPIYRSNIRLLNVWCQRSPSKVLTRAMMASTRGAIGLATSRGASGSLQKLAG